MHYLVRISLFFALVTSMVGCNTTSPQKYVEVTVLNTNLVTAYFRPPYFEEVMAHQGSAEAYVRQQTATRVEQALEKVNKLNVTDETQPLIKASRDFLTYGKELFETEYIDIAKMIDQQAPQSAIDTAIMEVFEKHTPIMDEKLTALETVAAPFAEKHGVDLRFD